MVGKIPQDLSGQADNRTYTIANETIMVETIMTTGFFQLFDKELYKNKCIILI